MGEGIGVLADSGGDLDAFGAAYELLVSRGAERFFFAGGHYTDLDLWIAQKRRRASQPSDAQALLRLESRFVRVCERGSPRYGNPGVGAKALDMLGDVLCCIVHDKDDLSRDDLLNASVFFHGGGSEPNVVQIGPRFFVTPGRLSGGDRQTCGLVQPVDGNLRFSAFCLDGQPSGEGWLLAIPRRAKMSIR